MKKIIIVLLTCSLGLAAGAGAKENPNNKAPAKSKPAPQQKVQHVKAGPRTAPKTHVKANRPQPTEKLARPKTHESHVSKEQLRKSPAAPAKELSDAQSQKLPGAHTDRKAAALPSKEAIEKIRAQHRNFKAKPNPTIASAQFNQNYQIAGAQNWSGPQYQVFASYRPQWHDQGWWQSRYSSNLLLIGGGWYYWDAGYWYPAWGYDQAAAYYPYDGPIYVGDNRTPFDQVVADCQATLQEQGYYKGEVDGLMGPLTRQALAEFQREHGLVTTAALDQPTLSSLGLG
jgi:hypothetical protein